MCSSSNITILFYCAGVMNVIGLVCFNNFYYDANVIENALPGVFSIFSQILIQLWGLAYIGAAKHWKRMPFLCFVFFIEKILFSYVWASFILDETNRNKVINSIANMEKLQANLFLLLFGVNDILFGLVFGYAALTGGAISPHKND
jgi:hypothetical protein